MTNNDLEEIFSGELTTSDTAKQNTENANVASDVVSGAAAAVGPDGQSVLDHAEQASESTRDGNRSAGANSSQS